MSVAVDAFYSNAKRYEIDHSLNVFGPNTEAIFLILVAIMLVTLVWKFL